MNRHIIDSPTPHLRSSHGNAHQHCVEASIETGTCAWLARHQRHDPEQRSTPSVLARLLFLAMRLHSGISATTMAGRREIEADFDMAGIKSMTIIVTDDEVLDAQHYEAPLHDWARFSPRSPS